jgi:hypothetical protein
MGLVYFYFRYEIVSLAKCLTDFLLAASFYTLKILHPGAEAGDCVRGDCHFRLVVTVVEDLIKDPQDTTTVAFWVTQVFCCVTH